MPKINKLPAFISAKINKDDPKDHFISADADATGAAFADLNEKVQVGIYKLVEVREVTMLVSSKKI